MALQQIANTDISSTGTFALGSVSSSALTSSRITYATTGGLLTDSAALTFNGTILTSVGFAGALNGTVGATSPSTVVATSVTNSGLTSGRITYASTGGLLVDSANLTFSGTVLTVGVTGLSANTDGTTGKLVLRKPNEATGNPQITRMLDFAPYYPGYDEAVVKASISAGVDTGTQNGQLGFMVATGGVLYEKMRILADGSVGIGTTTPSSPLDIVRSSTSTTGFAEPQMRVINTGTATLNQRVDIGMRWQDGTYNGIGGISMLRESATARSGSLIFSSIASDGNGLAAMHIKSTGKVGIGIGSPNANLQVTSDSFPVLKVADGVGGGAIALGDSTISDNYVGIWRGAANSISGGGYLNIQGNNIAFMSTDAVFGSATRTMTLDNSGNLLVGTTSVTANYKFVTSLSADTAAGMMIENTSNTVSAMAVMRYKNSGSAFAVTGLSSPTRAVYSTLGPNVLAMYTGDTAGMTFMVDANGPITFATGSSNAERMRISSDGTVNIGNPPPGGTIYEGNLVVAGSLGTGAGTASTRIQMNVYETVSGVASGVWFGALTNETTGVIGSRTATGNIAFQTYNGGWAERMRLTYTGYLGIGEPSPQTKLHMTDGTFRIDGVVAQAIYVRGGSTIKPYITINEFGTRQWDIGAGVYSAGSFSIQSNSVNGVYLGGTATSWASASDERIKDIIEPITDALTKVNGLRSVIGKYKTDEEGVRRSFLIAQDIQTHFPEALESSDPDKLGVQYTDVIPLLVAAIKEQQALIESMATKLKDAGVAGF
jgi:hypothetical protein